MTGLVQTVWARTPLPVETLAGVVVGVVAQRVRPLPMPAGARPVGLALVFAGFGLVVEAVRERGPGSVTRRSG